MELVYAAYQRKKLKFYSFDIETFFSYLKRLYLISPKLVYELHKFDLEKQKELFQITYPDLELVEFYCGVYLPIWEHRIWKEYFYGFYETTLKVMKDVKNKPPIALQGFDKFMDYLGTDKIRSVIESNMIGSMLGYELEFEQFQELRRKIEDI